MIQLVRKRGLITYTSEECMSAATLVLVSGKERVIAPNAKVGFHAGTFPGITSEDQRGMNDRVRSIMQSAGVSEAFIAHTLATSSDHIWLPSFDEMLRNGVATAPSYSDQLPSGQESQLAPEYVPPAQSLLAPEGYLFLTKRVDAYNTNLQTGTLVRFGERNGDGFSVTADGILFFYVPPDYVTNDTSLLSASVRIDASYIQSAANTIACNLRLYHGLQ